ncbi:hypothetical protein C3Y08_11185 [Burkholderia gladioli]|nr:hypothetical protein C3Y08_11185 [Burkholderia gladioli]
MMFDHADQAPNNARFNNIRFYISIDCHAMRYLLLQKDYYNGERRVYSEYLGGSLSNKGDTREVKGTYQQTIAERTCPSQGLS